MGSLRESISANIKLTLEGMRVGAGYNFDWATIYMFDPGTPMEFPSALVSEEEEEAEDLAYPKVRRHLRVSIEGWHKTPTTTDDEPHKTAQRLIEDLQRAMLQEPTRGSLAIDTGLVMTEAPVIWADEVHVICTFVVKYDTNRKDPSKST